MTAPQFITTEFTHGQIANCDYGSQVRVLLRSPTAILFTGLGFNIWTPRGSHSNHSLFSLTSERPTKASLALPKVQARIEEVFGEGAGALALKAWASKGQGTCLIDGGGDPMPPTRVAFRAKLEADFAAKTCDWSADLTGQVKTCKQCGAPLKPDTDHHRMGFAIQPDHPRTAEDCQKRTNRWVIAVHSYGISHLEKAEFVEWFETWDGESYVDEDFCYGKDCAAAYGRRAVRALPPLEPGGEVPKTPYRRRDDVKHFVEPPPTYVTGPNGERFRI